MLKTNLILIYKPNNIRLIVIRNPIWIIEKRSQKNKIYLNFVKELSLCHKLSFSNLYINLAYLGVCLFVGLWMITILRKCVLKVFNFVKNLNSWKSANFFLKICKKFFFFVLKCKQKEHVHNLNRRWAQKPSPYIFTTWRCKPLIF